MILEIGDKVVFTGELKMLNKGTEGVLAFLYPDWCVITYPQNYAHESDGKGGWEVIKGKPTQVYSHSAKLNQVKLANP